MIIESQIKLVPAKSPSIKLIHSVPIQKEHNLQDKNAPAIHLAYRVFHNVKVILKTSEWDEIKITS